MKSPLAFDEIQSRRFEGVATPVLEGWKFSNLIASTPEDDKRGVDFFGTDFKGRPCIVFCRARYREGGSVDPTFNWDQSVEKVLKLREENPERILCLESDAYLWYSARTRGAPKTNLVWITS